MKLALSGSAGTGKTTLAKRLQRELEIPYIEEGMRELLSSGLDMHALTIDDHRALMRKLWNSQVEEERQATSGFVADRSSLDYAAFWMHYGLYEDREASESWMDEMRAHAMTYDRVILLPWGALPLEADGVRTTNRWVQLRFQGIVEGCLARWLDEERLIRIPETTDFERRVAHVLEHLG